MERKRIPSLAGVASIVCAITSYVTLFFPVCLGGIEVWLLGASIGLASGMFAIIHDDKLYGWIGVSVCMAALSYFLFFAAIRIVGAV